MILYNCFSRGRGLEGGGVADEPIEILVKAVLSWTDCEFWEKDADSEMFGPMGSLADIAARPRLSPPVPARLWRPRPLLRRCLAVFHGPITSPISNARGNSKSSRRSRIFVFSPSLDVRDWLWIISDLFRTIWIHYDFSKLGNFQLGLALSPLKSPLANSFNWSNYEFMILNFNSW